MFSRIPSLTPIRLKVSRLGMSTHKEKIDAIKDLKEPKNVHELQVFLGMMVYFSSYTGDRGLKHASEKANNSHRKQSNFYCALLMSIC